MKLYLYQCLCENNRLDKRGYLTQLFELDGTLREECSLITPVIQVQLIELSKIIKANYAYIPDFGRYYYVDDIIGERTGIITLYMRSDVLMSFREGILNLDVFCSRNEYDYDLYIFDPRIPMKSQTLFGWGEIGNNLVPQFTSGGLEVPEYTYAVTVVYGNSDLYKNNDNIHDQNFGSGVNGSNATFIMNEKSYNYFCDTVSQSNWEGVFKSFFGNGVECITSIIRFPFNLSTFNSSSTGDQNIKIGTLDFETSGGSGNNKKWCSKLKTITYGGEDYQLYRPADVIGIEVIANHQINAKFNNFLDFSPYTKLSLYLPYIGFIDLDFAMFKDKYLHVLYFCSMTTGKFQACIYASPTTITVDSIPTSFAITQEEWYSIKKDLKFTYEGVIGQEIPVGLSNKGTLVRNLTELGIKTGLSIAGAVGGLLAQGGINSAEYSRNIAIGAKGSKRAYNISQMENKANFAEKSVGIISDTSLGLLNAINASPQCHGQVMDIIAQCINRKPILLRQWTDPADGYGFGSPTDKQKYLKLLGAPCCKNKKISELKGYTEIGGAHIEFNQLNSSPTNEERDEIDSILRSGVILPDPQENTLG